VNHCGALHLDLQHPGWRQRLDPRTAAELREGGRRDFEHARAVHLDDVGHAFRMSDADSASPHRRHAFADMNAAVLRAIEEHAGGRRVLGATQIVFGGLRPDGHEDSIAIPHELDAAVTPEPPGISLPMLGVTESFGRQGLYSAER